MTQNLFRLSLMALALVFLAAMPARAAEPATARTLSPEDAEILRNGEISDGAYIGGGIVGTVFGLGIGHAIQGRYLDKGWIFTVSEIGAGTLAIVGLARCYGDDSYGRGSRCGDGLTLATVAYLGLIGLRIWEIVDLWAEPPDINSRYRELSRARRHALGDLRAAPIALLDRAPGASGIAPGLGFSFSF